MGVNDTWIYLNLHLHESMTSLTGCHSTLFCTSSIGQKADVTTEWASTACPPCRSWGISQNSILKAQPVFGNCGAVLCMGFLGWDHVLSVRIMHSIWLYLCTASGESALGLASAWQLHVHLQSCAALEFLCRDIIALDAPCASCKLCKLCIGPCPRRKTQEQ